LNLNIVFMQLDDLFHVKQITPSYVNVPDAYSNIFHRM